MYEKHESYGVLKLSKQALKKGELPKTFINKRNKLKIKNSSQIFGKKIQEVFESR